MCSTNCFLYILALLFPPFPVWVKRGLCSADSLINIALCCLGVLPGILHSWYIIASTPVEYEEIYYSQVSGGDLESGRRTERSGDGNVRYIYVMQGGRVQQQRIEPASQQQRSQQQQAQQQFAAEQRNASHNYGAIEGPSSARSGAQEQGSSDLPPPTYHEAIKGDNKVQRP